MIQDHAYHFTEGKVTTSGGFIITVTAQGAEALIAGRLRIGQMIRLKFPMAHGLRLYDLHTPLCEIWGVVRSVGPAPNQEEFGERYEIGIAFNRQGRSARIPDQSGNAFRS